MDTPIRKCYSVLLAIVISLIVGIDYTAEAGTRDAGREEVQGYITADNRALVRPDVFVNGFPFTGQEYRHPTDLGTPRDRLIEIGLFALGIFVAIFLYAFHVRR